MPKDKYKSGEGKEGSSTEEQGHDPKYWVDYVNSRLKESKDWRIDKVEKQWMINYAYYRGLQNLRYDTGSKRLIWTDDDPLKFYVNLIYATVRAVKSVVTRSQPRWDVEPMPHTDLEGEQGALLGGFMNVLFEKLKMKPLIKKAVMYAMLYGVGIFQYGFDSEADDGEGELWVEAHDPFDVYIDPLTPPDNVQYIIKAMRKRISDIENNPLYSNVDKLKADNKYSESEYKEMLGQKAYGGMRTSETDGTVIIYEAWCRKDGKIHVITTAGDYLLRHEETDLEKIPFILYFPDTTMGEVYGEGWVKHIIPLNRALNYLERSTLEYNVIFSKGKYITDTDSKIKGITNEHGQILRVPRGSTLTQVDMKPLPSTPFNQVENILRYIQDVGASHEALMGRAPTGVTAAIALEQLVANSLNNIADLVDNLEIALAQLGEELLSLAYDKYTLTKRFKTELNGNKVLAAAGGRDVENVNIPDVAFLKLPERTRIRVRITSGMAVTKGGQQELLAQLRSGGDIDRRSLLEKFDQDADLIERRLFEERQGLPISEDGMTPDEMAQMQGSAQGGAPQVELPVGAPPEQFLNFLETNGLQLSREFEDEGLLQALIQGRIPYEVTQDGLVIPVPTAQATAQ